VRLSTSLNTTRLRDIKGALAVLVLEARAAKAKAPEILLELPYVSQAASRSAAEFMTRVAPETRYRLVPRVEARRRESSSVPASDIFSDQNQWLLKFLLFYAGERDRPRSVRTLAAAAEVSHPSAQRFARMFLDLGHLVVDDAGYRVVRRPELIRRWLAWQESWFDARIPVAARDGKQRALAEIAANLHREDVKVAFGGFAACKAHRALHVVTRPADELHMNNAARTKLERLFRRCAAADADFLIDPSGAREAGIFRPLAHEKRTAREIPVVDLLQAALDVWSQPSGREQARFVVDDVLGMGDGDQA
jgi:hypothetical protein